MKIKPRFDYPNFTSEPSNVVSQDISDQIVAPAMGTLVEPETDHQATVTKPSGDTLEMLAHRNIRCLSNYWHAGWDHAIVETWQRGEVAKRLYAVADGLPPHWGLAVFDAWRPLALQSELYDAAYADPDLPPGFMAEVNRDPATPPPHLSGGAVDLTLTYQGIPLALGTGFDDLTDKAHAEYFEGTPGLDRDLRRYLFAVMTAQSFVIYKYEWWHFEFGTRRWATITGAEPRYGATAP